MLTEGKITAVKKKTVILGLDSSSGREGRIHPRVSVKTTVPGWEKHLCFREEGQVRQAVFYELDWHKTVESVGTIQEIVILEEYERGKDNDAQPLCNIKVVPLLDLSEGICLFLFLCRQYFTAWSQGLWYLYQGSFSIFYKAISSLLTLCSRLHSFDLCV